MGEAPSGGTPTYMAPEQFQRNDREYGFWTDLYAVMSGLILSLKTAISREGVGRENACSPNAATATFS